MPTIMEALNRQVAKLALRGRKGETMDDTAVMEPATERKRGPQTPLTPEQKQASALRREATLLSKYGHTDEAAKLNAQADALAPVTKQGRVDPLKVLDKADQQALKDYFRTAQGFARLCQVVSAAKLQEIAEELSA